MNLNRDHLKRLSDTLNMIGVGQLAFFGFTAVRDQQWSGFVVSLILFMILEVGAVRLLRGGENK